MAVLLVLPLCACSADSVYTVVRNGREYVVDKKAGTISDGAYTYQYTFSGDSKAYSLEIEYPDGSTYWWQQDKSGMGWGGWSGDYDQSLYTGGDTLRDVLKAKAPRAHKYAGVGVLLLAVGAFETAAPRAAWYLRYGWRFKDAEPSDAALFLGRGGGMLAILVGIALLFL